MAAAVGRILPISLGRRIICDVLHFGMKVPRVTVQREMNLSRLAAAREYAQPRPSWCSIFTKAYAKVVAHRPDLRRALLTFPWERLVEYDAVSADVAVELRLGLENTVFFAQLKRPDAAALVDIDEHLSACKEKPIERMRRLRRALMLARFPRCVRRLVWWALLNVSAYKRSRYFSTFGVTSVAGRGGDLVSPLAPCITILHYGNVDPKGKVTVRLTFDHRAMDGTAPARALKEMEHVLNTDIQEEVDSMRRLRLFQGVLQARQAV